MWACSACTLENDPRSTACQLCGTPRPQPAVRPVNPVSVIQVPPAVVVPQQPQAGVWNPSPGPWNPSQSPYPAASPSWPYAPPVVQPQRQLQPQVDPYTQQITRQMSQISRPQPQPQSQPQPQPQTQLQLPQSPQPQSQSPKSQPQSPLSQSPERKLSSQPQNALGSQQASSNRLDSGAGVGGLPGEGQVTEKQRKKLEKEKLEREKSVKIEREKSMKMEREKSMKQEKEKSESDKGKKPEKESERGKGGKDEKDGRDGKEKDEKENGKDQANLRPPRVLDYLEPNFQQHSCYICGTMFCTSMTEQVKLALCPECMTENQLVPSQGLSLPPGWERRVDQATNRPFFVNHNLGVRGTSWFDPRPLPPNWESRVDVGSSARVFVNRVTKAQTTIDPRAPLKPPPNARDSSSVMAAVRPSGPWQCSKCTYENETVALTCVVCGSPYLGRGEEVRRASNFNADIDAEFASRFESPPKPKQNNNVASPTKSPRVASWGGEGQQGEGPQAQVVVEAPSQKVQIEQQEQGSQQEAEDQASRTWQCLWCTYDNHISERLCMVCGKSKESIPVKVEGEWTCTTCTFLNAVNCANCVVCGSSKREDDIKPPARDPGMEGMFHGVVEPNPVNARKEQVCARVKCILLTLLGSYFGRLTVSSTHLTFVGQRIDARQPHRVAKLPELAPDDDDQGDGDEELQEEGDDEGDEDPQLSSLSLKKEAGAVGPGEDNSNPPVRPKTPRRGAGTIRMQKAEPSRTLRIPLQDIDMVVPHRHHLRDCAIEICLKHSNSTHCFSFYKGEQDHGNMEAVMAERNSIYGLLCRLTGTAPLKSPLEKLNQKGVLTQWQKGHISNYDYLVFLNLLAGRSRNDLTQYPVFPWILSNYTSPNLDLNDPANYRDLSLPIGALNAEMWPMYEDRYRSLAEDQAVDPFAEHPEPPEDPNKEAGQGPQGLLGGIWNRLPKVPPALAGIPKAAYSLATGVVGEHMGQVEHVASSSRESRESMGGGVAPGGIPPFHYGSHYSSAGTVLYYLVRTQPYTTLAVEQQGGSLDLPDRLFTSIPNAWRLGYSGSADVKELIPEFFEPTAANFLRNVAKLPLGIRQNGQAVNDVELPPWAADQQQFVRINRQALESEIVSRSLHRWIDLIFGYQQTGKHAVAAKNVFYYLTYAGAVDIDKISDPAARAAVEDQIAHFGQTPQQILAVPHPRRFSDETLENNETRLREAEGALKASSQPQPQSQPSGVFGPVVGAAKKLPGLFDRVTGVSSIFKRS